MTTHSEISTANHGFTMRVCDASATGRQRENMITDSDVIITMVHVGSRSARDAGATGQIRNLFPIAAVHAYNGVSTDGNQCLTDPILLAIPPVCVIDIWQVTVSSAGVQQRMVLTITASGERRSWKALPIALQAKPYYLQCKLSRSKGWSTDTTLVATTWQPDGADPYFVVGIPTGTRPTMV